MTVMDSLQGKFLIASPRLRDPNFFKTVVMLVRHDEAGALGLVINRPLEMTLADAWRQVSETPCNAEALLHQGGPCEGPLTALHGEEEDIQLAVCIGVHFSSEREALEHLAANPRARARYFVGYSGWSAGQLERELAEGAWLTVDAGDSAAELLFGPTEHLWDALYRKLARAAGHPWMNPQAFPEDPSVN